jgi:hypothetical protein
MEGPVPEYGTRNAVWHTALLEVVPRQEPLASQSLYHLCSVNVTPNATHG